MAATATRPSTLATGAMMPGSSDVLSQNSYSVAQMSRLLSRLEEQLQDPIYLDDQWNRAGISLGLNNISKQLGMMARTQASTSSAANSATNLSTLKIRLQKAISQYNSAEASRAWRPRPRQSPQRFGISQSALSRRQFLMQGLLEESDSESDDEAAGLPPTLTAQSFSKEDKIGGVKKEANLPNEKGAQNKEDEADEDDLAAYESAAKEKGATSIKSGINDEKDPLEAQPTALQTERSVQDSLSGELLRMAGILKANSMAFADALERDRKILEQAGEQLQGNLTLMTRTRGKLGEYSKKARGMGWMTLGSIATVCISWIVMFILIKLT